MDDKVGIVTRFEDEFNKVNHDIVDELMSEDFVHHLPYPGLPAGRAGMKAVGQFRLPTTKSARKPSTASSTRSTSSCGT